MKINHYLYKSLHFANSLFILISSIQTYILMDHKIESRLNRSLAIHDLDNLVFEKRQRKIMEPDSLQFTPKQLTKKASITKKQLSPARIKESSAKRSATPIKKPTQIVPVKKKTLIKKTHRAVKNKIKQQQSSQEIIEESVEMDSSSSKHLNKKVESKRKKAKNSPIKINKKREEKVKVQEEDESESENHDNNVQLDIKTQSLKKQVKKQQPSIKQQNPLDQRHQPHPQSQKKKRGRPRKVVPVVQQCLEQKQQNQAPQKSEVILPQVLKKQQSENQPEQKLPQQSEVIKTRTRKANQRPVIKYNQNDQDINSDQPFEAERDPKKKKRISKANKGRNKQNKPYSLNRIFRKEPKKNFSEFQLKVNVGKLSLKEFVKQFGVFDIIHFSLPVKYLQLFPDMPILMVKGFVFLWVQKKETQIGYHLLNRWGYDVIDQIVWIKSNEQEGSIQAQENQLWRRISNENQKENNQLFLNIKSTCLVGYKCPLGNKAEYRTKVSNNIIFAKPQVGVKKPQEIYEIADLMMPGAKKLEFGGPSQNGWFNLKHVEGTIYRCHNCFKQQDLYLLRQASNRKVLCKRCLVQSLKGKTDQENKLQTLANKFTQLEKTKIIDFSYEEKNSISCPRCDRAYSNIAYQGFLRQQGSEDFMCIDCYQLKISSKDNKNLQILILKKNFFNQAQIQCSSCKGTTIYDLYFECSKCKNHRNCKKCFWRSSQPKTMQDEDLKKSRQNHEWKLKLIKSSPLTRFWCYECKKQMSLPFWCCETCQSWMWCGKCQRTNHEIHPHYQTDRHNEYLLI